MITEKERMMEMKQLFTMILVMCFAGFMNGCSELEEIEERGFVVGAAYDMVKEKQLNPISREHIK